MDGGSGNDLLEFFEAAGGATVDLASESVSVDGDGGVDIVLNFENVYGSNYSDDISGDEFDNILSGGTGDDTLFGGDGNDVLDGGDGNDFIDGGDGVDSVSFTSVSSSVYVNLAAGTAIGSEDCADGTDDDDPSLLPGHLPRQFDRLVARRPGTDEHPINPVALGH